MSCVSNKVVVKEVKPEVAICKLNNTTYIYTNGKWIKENDGTIRK
jgi:hypothetical protein